MMKGQLSLEYYISLLTFIGTVSFILMQILGLIPSYKFEAKKEIVYSEGFQISEMLVNGLGYPANWSFLTSSEIKRIGLNDEKFNQTNLISSQKINRLNSIFLTEGYEKVKELLGTEREFRILIANETQVLVDIQPTQPYTGSKARIERVVCIDGKEVGKVYVEVW